MSDDDKPKRGERYRHFKGGVYEVVDLFMWAHTGRWSVLYRNLDSGWLYGRDLDEFASDVATTQAGVGVKVKRFAKIAAGFGPARQSGSEGDV